MAYDILYTDSVVTKDRQLETSNDDYSKILNKYNIAYNVVEPHLLAGKIGNVQGWILHISVVRWQVLELFEKIIPVLLSNNVAFKIAKNKETVRNILDGGLGRAQVGKVISIYPANNELALVLAKQLIMLTSEFKGPVILTDARLGGNVYARYGAFKPIVELNSEGKEEKYIYNSKGQLIKDIYTIPFNLPKEVEWPFTEIKSFIPLSLKKKDLHPAYKTISLLKSDVKGNVYKALCLSKFFLIKRCIIKEGKQNMWSDEMGRDIADRLLWQNEIHLRLSTEIPIPKIIDLFVKDGDTYLAMEYVKGKSLIDLVFEINKHCVPWADLSCNQRFTLLNYLFQIASILEKLQQKGFVHRDITPVNFLVTKKNKIFLIDTELAYSIYEKKPTPPFEAGTYGFMSPDQLEVKTPIEKDDIYGFGATALTIYTAMSPLTFSHTSLSEQLLLLSQEESISKLITDCLNSEASLRPTIQQVRNTIVEHINTFKRTSNNETFEIFKKKKRPNPLQVEETITRSIIGLSSSPTVILDDEWYSRSRSNHGQEEKQKSEFSKSGGLFEGISGILYFLGKANQHGFKIDNNQKAYKKGWDFINNMFLKKIPAIEPGLYGGAAGISLALIAGMNAGLLADNKENKFCLGQCIGLQSGALDFSSGAAGQGIVALQSSSLLDSHEAKSLSRVFVDYLLSFQHKDNCWIKVKDKSGKVSNAISFSYGNTGIIWFLLEYSNLYNDDTVQAIAIKSLQALCKTISLIKRGFLKNGYRKIISKDPVIGDGISGLVLINMKAYEITKDTRYKQNAEELLLCYPSRAIHDNLTQDTGLADLGELYLEAFRLFKNDEWQTRADWIAQFLIQTSHSEQESIYWLSENFRFPTADFMTGNSGIIHFLIKYLYPNNIGYRLLK